MIKIKWEEIEENKNDLIARFGNYCLRVEKMDDHFFCYSVDFKNKEIASSDKGVNATTLREAKKICEASMIVHRRFDK